MGNISPTALASLRSTYNEGDKVKLIKDMADPFHPIKKGTIGTVKYVDDIGTIHTNWENGSSLGIIYDKDEVEKLQYWSIKQFISCFGNGELYPVRTDDKCYIISNYRFGDPEFDFGIYNDLSIEDALNGIDDGFSLIPDIFLDEYTEEQVESVYPKTKPMSKSELKRVIPRAEANEIEIIEMYEAL